jgi:flagellar hook-associated protein 1 FlgK
VSGTFSSVNNALSALRYQQVVMDVTSGNIANVGTDGYSRRRVDGVSVGAPTQPALWSRYDGYGDGVRVGGLSRLVDPLLDARARREHGNQSFLDVRQAVLSRVESGIGEPGDSGVSAAITQFRDSWQDLANSPGSEAARSQVLSRAHTVADAFAVQTRNITAEEGDQRQALLAQVGEVNTLASDLASANRSIHNAQLAGTDAGTLLDKRDQLALRLSELTGATATPNANGGLDVTVAGVALVSGSTAGSLQITSGVNPDGTADGSALSFGVAPAGGGAGQDVTGRLGGSVGAVAELLTTTLPGYRAGIEQVAKQLADQVNAVQQGGYDQDGNAGQPLLTFAPTAAGGPLVVAITDPRQVAASAQGGGPNLDGTNATNASRALVDPAGAYQRLVAGFGSDVAATQRLSANQQALTNQVDASRDQLSGVSLDEEMVRMMNAQRSYEAAARVMTTVDSVLDTLINRTGLVH